jgi:hypothetical protein
MNTNSKRILVITVFVLFIFLSFVYLYTLLHEGGHALVAMMYGGKIDRFVLGFNAHVGTSGASFTPFGESLFHLGGALLPVMVLAVALLFYNRNIKSTVYHYLYAVFTVSIIGSLIAWVAIPVISLFTAPPAGDDVTRFLDVSKLHPLFVSFISLLVILLIVFAALKKGMLLKIKEYLKSISKVEKTRFSKRQAVALVFLVLFLGIAVFFASILLFPKIVFETSFTMNIRENKKEWEMAFDVEKSKSYNLNVRLDAEGMLTDIQVYDSKGIKIYQNICEWCTFSTYLDLEKGNYRLALTFLKDPGEMERYLKEKDYDFSQDQIDMLKEIFGKSKDIEAIPISFSAKIKG